MSCKGLVWILAGLVILEFVWVLYLVESAAPEQRGKTRANAYLTGAMNALIAPMIVGVLSLVYIFYGGGG